MSSSKNTKNENSIVPISKEFFSTQQIDLFKCFLCNTVDERDSLSNTFDLWDSVPRYAMSRQKMTKIRKENGFLPLQHVVFKYRGRQLEARIQAAIIFDEKTLTEMHYYPSANEELVEDCLRKIATEQESMFFDQKNYRSGVVFTLHMLREEMKKRGHTRSYQQIVLSLKIMARSSIEIISSDGKGSDGFTINNYFSGLSAVSKHQLAEDPEAKWIVQFHPLVTQAIDKLTYRQFNYAQMMSHSTQLARWLHRQLALKFTFASLSTSFEIRYSTIKRDSCLLDGYARERAAIAELDAAWNELKANGVLMQVEKGEVRGKQCKLEDVVYTLVASIDFITQMKASNKRPYSDSLTGQLLPVDNLLKNQ